jgi:hypothetical protein
MTGDLSLTRRELVRALALAGATVGVLPLVSARDARGAAAPTTSVAVTPVVSFFMDQPYVDHSGTAVPYHAPLGARSAEPLAHLTVAEW